MRGEEKSAWSSIYPSPHPGVTTTTTSVPTRTAMARGLEDIADRVNHRLELVNSIRGRPRRALVTRKNAAFS
jgi:hypothetical protein